jgi:hypothetical protein
VAPTPLDPEIYLPASIAINEHTKQNLISNNYGNYAALSGISIISQNPLYQKAELGGIWFLEPNWNPIGYQYPIELWSNLSMARNWFESLGLSLGGGNTENGIYYFTLISV